MIRSLVALATHAVRSFGRDNGGLLAAAISYYALFSLFPFLIFWVGVMGLFLQDPGLQADVIDAVLENVPLSEAEGRDDVSRAVRSIAGPGSGAVGVAGLATMAWSASSMFAAVRRSLNIAFKVENPRPILRQKALDLLMVAGFGLFFVASIAATALLRAAEAASDEIPVLGDWATALGPGWQFAAILVPLMLSFGAFFVVYWLVPAGKRRPADVWPGALAAALLFELAKTGFAVYLANFGRYDVVFGSLGAVAAFLFWVYLSANILLLGAEIAAAYPALRRGHFREPALDIPDIVLAGWRRALRVKDRLRRK